MSYIKLATISFWTYITVCIVVSYVLTCALYLAFSEQKVAFDFSSAKCNKLYVATIDYNSYTSAGCTEAIAIKMPF